MRHTPTSHGDDRKRSCQTEAGARSALPNCRSNMPSLQNNNLELCIAIMLVLTSWCNYFSFIKKPLFHCWFKKMRRKRILYSFSSSLGLNIFLENVFPSWIYFNCHEIIPRPWFAVIEHVNNAGWPYNNPSKYLDGRSQKRKRRKFKEEEGSCWRRRDGLIHTSSGLVLFFPLQLVYGAITTTAMTISDFGRILTGGERARRWRLVRSTHPAE